jgi:hypothetical protein
MRFGIRIRRRKTAPTSTIGQPFGHGEIRGRLPT